MREKTEESPARLGDMIVVPNRGEARSIGGAIQG